MGKRRKYIFNNNGALPPNNADTIELYGIPIDLKGPTDEILVEYRDLHGIISENINGDNNNNDMDDDDSDIQFIDNNNFNNIPSELDDNEFNLDLSDIEVCNVCIDSSINP